MDPGGWAAVWFRVDDTFHDHKKVRKLGPDRLPALGLWALCGSWAADRGTDGFVGHEVVTRFDAKGRYARRLVDAELWIPETRDGEPGYRFHDWADYQLTTAEVQELSRKRAEAGRLGGLRSGQARRRRQANGEASGEALAEALAEANAEAKSKQTRSPGTSEPKT